MADRPTRILVLGGGFGGVYTAITLEKLLKRELKDGRVELGLVSRDNYIVFQPMLPEVISGSIGLVDTITPIRRLCPRTNLYTRTVETIDLERRQITATAGFGSGICSLPFDHLVVALGNVTSFAGQPGLMEHALPFKYLGDALEVTRNVPGQGDVSLSRLGSGECFGEIATVREGPRNATVKSLSRVDVVAIDREAFGTLFAHLPSLKGFVESLIQERLRAAPPPPR